MELCFREKEVLSEWFEYKPFHLIHSADVKCGKTICICEQGPTLYIVRIVELAGNLCVSLDKSWRLNH